MSTLITNATRKNKRDTSGNWTSNNPVLLAGEIGFETDTLRFKIGNGVLGWNALSYYIPLGDPKIVDLTSANVTYTLPTGISNGFVQDIFWSNGGTYKLTMATSDSSTIGGITAGTWLGEGEGNMTVIYDSANNDWKVRAYDDSGGNVYGSFIKQLKNLTCTGYGVFNESGLAIAPDTTRIQGAKTLPHVFATTSGVIVTGRLRSSLNVEAGSLYINTSTMSTITAMFRNNSNQDVEDVVSSSFIVSGTWIE